MLKKVLIALGLVIFALICFVFYLINPFDAQYKTFDLEAKAQEAFKKDDMDAYVKYMNNPVTVKYHAPIGLYVTLITLGRMSGEFVDRKVSDFNSVHFLLLYFLLITESFGVTNGIAPLALYSIPSLSSPVRNAFTYLSDSKLCLKLRQNLSPTESIVTPRPAAPEL